MASWIWAASPFDLLVDKATSANLPIGTEDIATSLEIADQIRAKAVLPKAAVTSLKRKVGDKNPNVQKLSFGLVDCCIKNGGDHFLVELAARDFVDNLASILRLQSTNPEVKRVGLDLFQQWALAFQAKPELGYVCEVYKQMKDEGVPFPPPPAVSLSAALLSTSTAPAWVDSEVCLRCRTPFSFTNRKHHCRNCGKVFDQSCSSHNMPLPHFGIAEEVRVCDGCWGKSKTGGLAKQASLLHTSKQAAAGPAPAIPRKSHHPDSDLARAIALSLAESQASSGTNRPGFVPTSSEPPIRGGRKEEGNDGDGEEDEDLRAAIEASLKEMRDAPSAPVGGDDSADEARSRPYVNPNELTPRETDALLTFSQTIEQAARQGEPDLRRYPHAHELYANASGLRGKLGDGLNEAHRKEYMLNQMQGKLSSAVQLYDQLLGEQHAYSERQRQQYEQNRYAQQAEYGGYTPYGQPPQQGYHQPPPTTNGGWEHGRPQEASQQQPWAGYGHQQPVSSPYGQPNPWASGEQTPTAQQPYGQQPARTHASSPYASQPPAQSTMYPQLPSAAPQAHQPDAQAPAWAPQSSPAGYVPSPDPNAQGWPSSPQDHQQQQRQSEAPSPYTWDPVQNQWVLGPAASGSQPPLSRSTSVASTNGVESAPPHKSDHQQYRQQSYEVSSPSASAPTAGPWDSSSSYGQAAESTSTSTPTPTLNPNAPSWTPSAFSQPASTSASNPYPTPATSSPAAQNASTPHYDPYATQSQPSYQPAAQYPSQSHSQPNHTPSYPQYQQQPSYPTATEFPSVPTQSVFPSVPDAPFAQHPGAKHDEIPEDAPLIAL